jgi:hypothetical protein
LHAEVFFPPAYGWNDETYFGMMTKCFV